MSYKADVIKAILYSYGIKSLTDNAIDSVQGNQYYDTLMMLTAEVLEDRLVHAALQTENKSSINICFLLIAENGLMTALILFCKNSHNTLTEHQRNTLSISSENTANKLYETIESWYLGPASIFNPVWIGVLQKLAINTKSCIQKLERNSSYPVILTEFILQLLSTETVTASIDVKACLTKHTQQCALALYQQLSILKHDNEQQYVTIKRYLAVLFKYNHLLKIRSQQRIENLTVSELERLKQLDRDNKCIIYGQPDLTIDIYLKALSINTLTLLLSYKDSKELIRFLQKIQNEQLHTIRQWGEELIHRQNYLLQTLPAYIRWQRSHIIQAIYNHTYIGLGAELTPCLIYVMRLRVSPTCLYLSKIAGGCLGLLYSYALGSHYLARMLLVFGFNYLLKNKLDQAQLNDQKATINHSILFTFLNATSTSMMYLMLAMIETVLTGNYRYLAESIGAMMGSLLILSLVKYRLTARLPEIHSGLNEIQVLTFLFSSLIGLETGRLIAGYIYNFFANQILCEKVGHAFQEAASTYSLKGMQAQCRDASWLPAFWSNPNPRMTVSWTTAKEEYLETECQLVTINNKYIQAVCEQPLASKFLRLG